VGCNNTSPEDTLGISPENTLIPSNNNEAPVITDDPNAEPSDIPWWAPPPITAETTEIDPTQTGELIIYLPPYSWWWLNPAIDFYKEIYPNVELIVEDIGDNYFVYGTRLSAELAAGTGPDILFPQFMFGADMYKMADAGAFLDLNEFIQQDENFNFSDYVMPVLDGGIYNGKRYLMPYEYNVNVFISIPSKLDEIGFDMTSTNNPISFISEITRTLPKAQTNPLFQSMVSGNLWYNLFYASGIKYIDFETNTVLPYENAFEEFVKAYKPYRSVDNIVDINILPVNLHPQYLRNGTINFGWTNSSIGYIILASQVNAFDDVQMHIIPDINGNNHANCVGAAIRSGTQNHTNAWNFIKILLSPENQTRVSFNNIPVHINSLIAQLERLYNHYDGVHGDMTCAKLSDEMMQSYIALITSVDVSTAFYSGPAGEKFYDQLEPFFQGDRSYEDSIARLRNDLRLYMSE
jgi:ABC-type glycerol-3-phosphate transport system substrate-binding protein